ncbi:unnamed protein product [Didymodactylos carnosus]|uniref:Uncharacterized protein n=1 Tax=Didymodactylos carnosus TaxID=1234261 RepID=A0A8S2DHD5_9BILA|nr:unnamed protein product [Didymodactylos carnosus]CAF3677501.1 unnamed protein product [Didymodactylos carnosus]
MFRETNPNEYTFMKNCDEKFNLVRPVEVFLPDGGSFVYVSIKSILSHMLKNNEFFCGLKHGLKQNKLYEDTDFMFSYRDEFVLPIHQMLPKIQKKQYETVGNALVRAYPMLADLVASYDDSKAGAFDESARQTLDDDFTSKEHIDDLKKLALASNSQKIDSVLAKSRLTFDYRLHFLQSGKSVADYLSDKS